MNRRNQPSAECAIEDQVPLLALRRVAAGTNMKIGDMRPGEANEERDAKEPRWRMLHVQQQ